MNILGISAHYHDSAAALVIDGMPVCAVQEERLSRRKNDAAFPLLAIEWCLEHAGLAPDDLDAVVFYERPMLKFDRILTCALRAFPRSWRTFPEAMKSSLGEKVSVRGTISSYLGVPARKILFTRHHQSHAAAAFLAAPTDRAAILTTDGVGEWATLTVGQGARVWLRARAGRSEFARLLDRAIALDARIAEIGCGTGQMSLYLSRARRIVIGADLSRESLRVAVSAAQRFELDRVRFVETDLHRPGLRASSFDVVYSSGVLHHTPDPRVSFARLVRLARPGGTIVLGLYNAFARIPLRLRRVVARLSRYRLIPFDPVMADRRHQAERREAWVRDQYRHPEEHRHTLAEVQRWFAENGVEYLRSYPSAVLGSEPGDLFARAEDNWRLEGWLAQLGWIRALGHEGGVFVTIGRRVG